MKYEKLILKKIEDFRTKTIKGKQEKGTQL